MCKVSVIIPYYNREKTLIRALQSVVNQSFKDFEIILVDDGSTDNSHKLADEFMENHKNICFKHIYQKNSGPSRARNEGIRASEGQYIAFLDSDDSWERDKLCLQIGFMEKNKDIMISSTNYNIIKNGDIWTKENFKKPIKKSNFYKMLFKVFFCIPTTVVRSEVFRRDGLYFLEGKHQAEDNLFFLQVARKYKGAKLSQPLTNIYKREFGEGGLSGDLSKLRQNEFDNFIRLYRDNKNNSKKINIILLLVVLLASEIRHLKRLILTRIRR
ncbi:glycosyl transferase [Fervidicella metallireducens AeB]|uniref:Glycosyl transferase n=1 Tax=Fervidicella metallireducens AeB TaxID=1403537 RepID=A0A017RY18_9CLOT|nr:glycosyltransferase family 2 protein [Fervidicella metallireducens]EYE89476.1 glycosyl transferase [Fervidicella metallireducens AeB]